MLALRIIIIKQKKSFDISKKYSIINEFQLIFVKKLIWEP